MSALTVFGLLLAGRASAQQESGNNDEKWPEQGRVIVVSPEATVQIAEKDPRPVQTAKVLAYSRTNDTWLWVDELWGWIDRSEVIPLDDAEEYYEAVIKNVRESGGPVGVAFHQRGIARLALQKHQDALADFDAAIEAGYQAANVYINRGQTLALLGKKDAAIESLTEAIAIAPKNGLAYDARAVELANQDFLDVALTDADKAVELAPEESRVWYDRGLLRQRDGQFKNAIVDYNKALQLAPRYVEAVVNRGYCLKRLQRFADAAKDYRQAVTINPKLIVARNDLAWLLATCPDESIRDSQDAISYARSAVEMSESPDGRFLDTLAAAYASAEQWDDAVATARQAIELLSGADQYAADQRLTKYLRQEPFVE